MKKYVAFLRGINVGNIRIKMPDLKAAFEELDFGGVRTYLQTGNVVFEADQTIEIIKPILEKKLSDTFHYAAFVLLYEFDSLADVVAQYPFSKEENHHAYVVFIDDDPVFEELKSISKQAGEEANFIQPGNGVLYWKVAKGESLNTVFAKILAKAKYKSNSTIRNINTLKKMLDK